jgi:M6 family metalloprotease-like protein
VNATAAIKAGASCKKAGQTSTFEGKKYTCVKSGKKLVWSKGVAIAKATPVVTPTPTPTVEPTPTPTQMKPSNLSTDSSITASSDLTNLSVCKTTDLTTRSGGRNGFPRPEGVLSGAVSPSILFIPIVFSDTPSFTDADLNHAEETLKEVKDFYKTTSYGLVNINYQILEKSKWIISDRSAESYGLTNPRPQQNNTDAVKELLSKVDPSVNFDLYDGVILETVRYPGRGVGQSFSRQTFPTRNGIAKGVSLETSMAAGSFQTLAHELGHALFGLEDLYVFLNDQRPSVPGGANPAGPWDLMSYPAREFFGWSKFLNNWFESGQVRCLTNQSVTVHYLDSLELINKQPKLLLINLQEGVTIGVEVRKHSRFNFRGVLAYKVDSRINHGDGPITAEKELLYEGFSALIDGWRISALEEGLEGLLVKVEKVG